MPVITGELGWHGAIIPILVGVSRDRRARLESLKFPVPKPVTVMAQIDTGAHVTSLMPHALHSLEISPFTTMQLRTPSTTREKPHECLVFDVSIVLLAGTASWEVPSVHIVQCDDFNPDENVQALIGRDILKQCVFTFSGPHQNFSLAF
jgi:hypothetical protein